MKPNAAPLRVAILSDVSVGYGTPQILRMAESFAKVFDAEVHIFEPDQPERPPIDIRAIVPTPRVSLKRIYTSAHPYQMEARVEFCRRVADLLSGQQLDIIILSTMYSIAVLDYIDLSNTCKFFMALKTRTNIILISSRLYGVATSASFPKKIVAAFIRSDFAFWMMENRFSFYTTAIIMTHGPRQTPAFSDYSMVETFIKR